MIAPQSWLEVDETVRAASPNFHLSSEENCVNPIAGSRRCCIDCISVMSGQQERVRGPNHIRHAVTVYPHQVWSRCRNVDFTGANLKSASAEIHFSSWQEVGRRT